MINFQLLLLYTSFCKPEFWVRFKDDIFFLWEHDDESCESFLHLLNSLDPKLKLTQELEVERRLPFLDVLVHRNDTCFEFRVYRKPTHSDRYLNHSSNHSPLMKTGVVTSLVDRALQVCSPRFLNSELDHFRDILFGNGYPISLINSVIAKRIKKLSDTDTVNTNQRENSVYLDLPYIKGVSHHIFKNLQQNNIFTYYRPRKTISSQTYQEELINNLRIDKLSTLP